MARIFGKTRIFYIRIAHKVTFPVGSRLSVSQDTDALWAFSFETIMARKRMIDPEFWSDEQVGKWSYATRLFYIGLWNFADDKGKFKAPVKVLKAQIFPYDEDIDIEKVKKELGDRVVWYEIDGYKYGYLPNFLKWQTINHPTPSKLPNPPTGLTEDSRNPNVGVPRNLKEVNLKEVNIIQSNIIQSKEKPFSVKEDFERHLRRNKQ